MVPALSRRIAAPAHHRASVSVAPPAGVLRPRQLRTLIALAQAADGVLRLERDGRASVIASPGPQVETWRWQAQRALDKDFERCAEPLAAVATAVNPGLSRLHGEIYSVAVALSRSLVGRAPVQVRLDDPSPPPAKPAAVVWDRDDVGLERRRLVLQAQVRGGRLGGFRVWRRHSDRLVFAGEATLAEATRLTLDSDVVSAEGPRLLLPRGERTGWLQGEEGTWHLVLGLAGRGLRGDRLDALDALASAHRSLLRLTPSGNLVVSDIAEADRDLLGLLGDAALPA